MSPKGHKRRLRPSHKALALVSALVLGGGGVVIVEQAASAGQDSARSAPVTATIDCPDVGDRLREVPEPVRAEVDQNLAQLDTQIADSYQRLATGRAQGDALLGELKDKRQKTITGMADAIGRSAARPQGLEALSGCSMKQAPAADAA